MSVKHIVTVDKEILDTEKTKEIKEANVSINSSFEKRQRNYLKLEKKEEEKTSFKEQKTNYSK